MNQQKRTKQTKVCVACALPLLDVCHNGAIPRKLKRFDCPWRIGLAQVVAWSPERCGEDTRTFAGNVS